jgi:carbamoyl-phosphate synthase large subunit
MQKPLITVAVTGLNAIDSPGPGLAVIRSLRAAKSFNVRIIGLSYESLEPVIYLEGMADKTFQIPYPGSGQEVLLERLRYICESEKVAMLFPNFDAELFNFIKLQPILLQELGIHMMLPTLEQFEARQKTSLYEYGVKHGIEVPMANMVFTTREIVSVAEKLGYPLVVKGKFYDAKIAYNLEQATQGFNKISAQWGLPIILQKFIMGAEVNVCGLGDGTGKLMGAVPMRKLYITDKGKAWAGVSLDDKRLLEITKQMVEKTKWNGPFEMEFIKTTNDKSQVEEYHLLEINPRFPAWCYLTTGCGQNLVESAVNFTLGRPAKYYKKYKVGTMFIRYSNDLIVDIDHFETISTDGELTLKKSEKKHISPAI